MSGVDLAKIKHQFEQRQQVLMDKLTPHTTLRWAMAAALILLFTLRIYFVGGFYIVAYGLGIYLLNLLIGFLSPRVDPEFALDETDEDLDDVALPTQNSDEFKPFIRRLPEFKFWLSFVKATTVSLFLTLFSIVDVPVYYPILLVYFIGLFVATMKTRIQHMIKYKYVPFDWGKKPKFAAGGSAAGAPAPKRAD